MPSGFLCTTLRQSSTQPMAPKPKVTSITIQTKRLVQSNHSSVRDADADQDQHAAHGRRAALGQVRLHAVVADRLADLQLGQAADHPGPEGQADQQRRHGRHHRAEGQVLEDAQEAEFGRSACSHWARLSSMGGPLVLSFGCAAARDHALHLHEARPLTSTLAQRGAARRAARFERVDVVEVARAGAGVRVAAARRPSTAARCRARAHRRRPRRGRPGPASPTSPMSPSTSQRGPGSAASTSMAARTESGLAL